MIDTPTNDTLAGADFPARWARLLHTAATSDGETIAEARAILERGQMALEQAFCASVAIETLVAARAQLIDHILINVWTRRIDGNAACLVAVGGYGRAELLPHSDIDLLVIYEDGHLQQLTHGLEAFVTHLWDIGLKIGHSVRSPAECAEQAAADVTTMTNLLEARPLAGNMTLFAAGWAAAPGARFRLRSAPGIRITIADLDTAEIEALADAVAEAVHSTGRAGV